MSPLYLHYISQAHASKRFPASAPFGVRYRFSLQAAAYALQPRGAYGLQPGGAWGLQPRGAWGLQVA